VAVSRRVHFDVMTKECHCGRAACDNQGARATMFPLLLSVALSASPLTSAQGKLNRFDFEGAIVDLDRCRWCTGAAAKDEVACIALWGQILEAVNRPSQAETVFFDYLADHPHAELPDVPPKVAELFVSAKRRRYPPPSVTARLVEGQAESSLAVVDPWVLVSRLQINADSSAETTELPVVNRRALRLPELDASKTYRFSLLDRNGLVLFELEKSGQRPFRKVLSPWLIGAGAALSVAGSLLLVAAFSPPANATDGDTAAMIQKQNQTARALAVGGYATLGVGVAAIGSGILLRW
jgi:hypothetical protein